LVRSVSIPTKDNAGRSMIRPQQLSPHDFPRTNFIYGNTPLIYLGLVLKINTMILPWHIIEVGILMETLASKRVPSISEGCFHHYKNKLLSIV
jgi:hypothetical protein